MCAYRSQHGLIGLLMWKRRSLDMSCCQKQKLRRKMIQKSDRISVCFPGINLLPVLSDLPFLKHSASEFWTKIWCFLSSHDNNDLLMCLSSSHLFYVWMASLNSFFLAFTFPIFMRNNIPLEKTCAMLPFTSFNCINPRWDAGCTKTLLIG